MSQPLSFTGKTKEVTQHKATSNGIQRCDDQSRAWRTNNLYSSPPGGQGLPNGMAERPWPWPATTAQGAESSLAIWTAHSHQLFQAPMYLQPLLSLQS